MSGVTVVNFSHPLTEAQLADLGARLGHPPGRVIDVPAHFDPRADFGPQAEALVAAAGLHARAWQTEPVVVNLPSYAAIAALVLARLHGLMGHFPAIVRLRPVANAVPPAFEFAELIDLNVHRIRAAQRAARPREEEVP